MTYAAGTPSWTDLMTSVPDQSKAFYTALFGWNFGESSAEFGHYAMAFKDGRSAAGIMPAEAGSPMPGAWTVYFASDDLDADAERVWVLGGQVMVAPVQVGDQGKMGVFTDPTGAAFGLWQAGQHQGAESREGEGTVVWVEVNTRDAARAVEFYRALFHADSEPVPGMDYVQLMSGGQGYAGVSEMGEQWEAVAPNHWVTYFYVQSVDEAIRVAEASGGKMLVPAFDTPYGRMAVLADPGGASFSVMTPGPRGQ